MSIHKKMMPNSVNSRRELRKVLLEQVGFQKRFLKYPWNSVYRAAIPNRGKAYLWDSEYSRVGWERGMLQSCSLSQDRKVKEFTLFCKSRMLSQELTHSRRIPFLLHRQFVNSQLSGSICYFATDYFYLLNFLAISCAIFLEDAVSNFELSK